MVTSHHGQPNLDPEKTNQFDLHLIYHLNYLRIKNTITIIIFIFNIQNSIIVIVKIINMVPEGVLFNINLKPIWCRGAYIPPLSQFR